MATRNVVLTEHQTQLIDRLVASGRFQNASEAMRAGLRLLETEERNLDKLGAYFDALLSEADASRSGGRSGRDGFAGRVRGNSGCEAHLRWRNRFR